MTIPFQTAAYAVRLARSDADIARCQDLRHWLFFGVEGRDVDQFDCSFHHLMIEDINGRLVATGRFALMANGAAVGQGYAAQSYDLTGFAHLPCPMIEVGRFCIRPDVMDADVLRVAWAALTQIVDANDVAYLYGCTSFAGTDPRRYGRVFAHLAAHYQGPPALSPAAIATHAVRFAGVLSQGNDPMPPLLRSYLGMGGWVGDHVVIDHAMDTQHVFTCLPVAAIPANRARALRALAQEVALS